MESCASEALTSTGPVQILSVDAQPWRVASPQDQSLLSHLSPSSLHPLTWLGEGAYGCVELCRVSVSIPATPRDGDSPAGQKAPSLQQLCPNTAGECIAVSRRTVDSCEDPINCLRPAPAAEVGLSGSSTLTAAAAVPVAGEVTAGSEALLSPRERVVIRPGRFSVNRLRMSPQQQDPFGPQPSAAAPQCTPTGYLARLHLHGRHGPASCSTPPAPGREGVPGVSLSLTAAASPGGGSTAVSGGWPATPSSTGAGRGPAPAAGTSGAFFGRVVSFYPRQRSSGSTTTASATANTMTTAPSSAPPSARSPRGQQPPPSNTASPNPTAAAAAAAVLSNELVVAVKRVGYRGPGARSTGGAREPDGCAAGCTGGAVGRARGGNGPSRTKLNRMQAIELLQLSRCRECPFIVRVFGCVPDDPRSSGGTAGNAATSALPPKQSPRPSKLSPRRPAGAALSSSSSSSCRIVMEWAEGGDLGSLLKTLSARRGPCSDPSRERLLMSEASARFYLACLLEALTFLHGKGLLHRDVKPANLLLTSDGRAKLGDLGMVCHLDRDGMAAGRAGTPNYMAPEVWAYGTGPKFSSYGANADLWSAGMVLHELLTGHLPANHPDEYHRRNWTFTPRHVAFSPELRDLLTRLLTPRPRRRLQNCAEVVCHPWFTGFDWQGLRDGTLQAPYVPAAHRPPGSGGSAAGTAGTRLRQFVGITAPTAVGPSGVAGGGPAIRGAAGELMPPLLEENGLQAISLEEGDGDGAVVATSANTSSGHGNRSGDAAQDCASAALDTPSGPSSTQLEAAASRRGDGRGPYSLQGPPQAASAAGPSELQAASAGTPAGGCGVTVVVAAATAVAIPLPPSSSNILPISVWRSLGWSTAADSRQVSGVGVPTASAPASAASLSVSVAAGTVGMLQAGLPRRGASQGSGFVPGNGTSKAVRPSGGNVVGGGGVEGGNGGRGFGFLTAALTLALSPIAGSPKTARQPAASTGCAPLAGTTANASSSNNSSGIGTSGGWVSRPCRCAASQAGTVTADNGGCRHVCEGGGSAGTKANSSKTSSPVRAANRYRPAALLLSTDTIAVGTASASASDCALSLRGDSGTSATGSHNRGRGGAGTDLRGVNSSRRCSMAGGSLAASCDLQEPSLSATPSVEMTAASAAMAEALSRDHPRVPPPTRPAVGPRGDPRPRGRSAGGLTYNGRASILQIEYGSSSQGRLGRQPQPAAAMPAAEGPALPLVGALSSLQQHVQGLGPAGQRAGWWLQQRLADAAALAVALPDQLQSAAAAAAAAVGAGGGGARQPPTAAGRVCRSDGGAEPSATPNGAAMQRISVVAGTGARALQPCGEDGPDAPVEGEARSPRSPVTMEPDSGAVQAHESAAASAPFPRSIPTSPCCVEAFQPPNGEHRGGLARPAAPTQRAPSSEWLGAAGAPRSSSAGGAIDRGERDHGEGLVGGARSSSLPAMLRPPLSRVQQQETQTPQSQTQTQLQGRQDSMSALARDGSDAATVLVLVRGACGAVGASGALGTDTPTSAMKVHVTAEEADVGQARDGGAADSGHTVDQTSGSRLGVGGGGGAPTTNTIQPRACSLLQSPTTAGPEVVDCEASAAVAAAYNSAATDAPPRQRSEPTASLPSQPPGPPNPRAHRRTTSFCFDPLDQGRPAGQASGGSPTKPAPAPSSCSQPRNLVQSHVRSHSFNFDLGGILSAGALLSGSPVLQAGAAAADASGNSGRTSAALASACAATALGTAPEVAATSPRASSPVRICGHADRHEIQKVAAVAMRIGNGHDRQGTGANGGQEPPASPAVEWGGLMPHLQPRHWHTLHTSEAAILLYMACLAALVMALAVIRQRGEAF